MQYCRILARNIRRTINESVPFSYDRRGGGQYTQIEDWACIFEYLAQTPTLRPVEKHCFDLRKFDFQSLTPSLHLLTVYAMTVANRITRSSIKRKCFDNLLGCPLRRWMFRHVEVNNSPSVVGKHDEDEQNSERRSRDNEKVDRYEISNMLE
jgi:hypothetical protein